MSSGEERRKYIRLNKIIGIEYQDNSGQTSYSMTLDISQSGIAFLTKDPIITGNPFEIKLLREKADKPIIMKGKVIRCLEQDTGCIIAGEFDPLTDAQRDALKKFIEDYKN